MTTEVLIVHLTKGHKSKLHVIGYNPTKLGDDSANETVLATLEHGEHVKVLVHSTQAFRVTEEAAP